MLFKTGMNLTLSYLVLIIALRWPPDILYHQLQTMPLNELGDFFAGLFSPVAFLWLILGFLQQSRELGQNTEALSMQADELKKAVKHQNDMVLISKRQMQEEREKYRKSISPHFIYVDSLLRMENSDGMIPFELQIQNSGKQCSHTNITITDVTNQIIYSKNYPSIPSGKIVYLDWEISSSLIDSHQFITLHTSSSVIGGDFIHEQSFDLELKEQNDTSKLSSGEIIEEERLYSYEPIIWSTSH
ncbi:hypothetical protein [Spongorhabdus nitratireducens]